MDINAIIVATVVVVAAMFTITMRTSVPTML